MLVENFVIRRDIRILRQPLFRRVHACVDSGGGYLQYFFINFDFINNKNSKALSWASAL